jgi:hypothetical protein
LGSLLKILHSSSVAEPSKSPFNWGTMIDKSAVYDCRDVDFVAEFISADAPFV